MLTKTKKKMKLPFVETIGFIVLVIFISGFLSSAKPATQESDVETCIDCHEDLASYDIWKEASRLLRDYFDSVTLQDLIKIDDKKNAKGKAKSKAKGH